ncbi:hypothetical protein N7470_006401 [Penicillium chermesinum]|nr:hypothetical protein N7470_006401 [Penicillium chermesinum]
MFLSTDNFVHFFSTSDRAVADEWHHAVQQWRSWYLINELGAILPTEETASPKGTSTQRRGAQRPTYESPLVDQIPGDGSPPLRTAGISQSTSAQDLFSRKKSTREHPAPPTKPFHETIAINTRVDKHPGPAPPLPGMSPEEEPETFSPTGLLGRTYTQRRAAMQEREEREKREKQDPWLYPSGAMIPEMPSHPNGAPTAKGPRGRSESIGQSNRPLVDLTPVFREPPQHTRKGRGVTIEAGRQLIEGATGPDLTPGAMPIPSAQAWRRPPAPRSQPTPRRCRCAPTQSAVHDTAHSPSGRTLAPRMQVRLRQGGPFIPNTLLAPSKQRAASYDQTPKSRRGMQDIALENPFADGGAVAPGVSSKVRVLLFMDLMKKRYGGGTCVIFTPRFRLLSLVLFGAVDAQV